jgi:hypothetical protein
MTEGVTLEFTDPTGYPLRIEWRAEALSALVAPQPDPDPAWRLAGELDWDEIEGLRIISARIGADLLLAVGAVRPRGAAGHGDELVAGAVGDGEAFERLEEALVSTEYGADGAVRRIGLELYRGQGGFPIRVAGDRIASSSERGQALRRDTATFELRSAGEQGIGVLDVLTSTA